MVTAKTTSAKTVKVVTSKPVSPSQLSSQNPIAYRKYRIASPRLTWVIQHNLNTTKFMVTCRDENQNIFQAAITTVDSNAFTINLTEAISGTADVVFDTSTTQPITIQ